MSDIPPLPPGFSFRPADGGLPPPSLPPLPPGFSFRPSEVAPAETTAPEPRSYAASDVLPNALTNFIPSVGKQLGEMGEGIVHAVTNPIDTASALGRLVVDAATPGVVKGLVPLLAERLGQKDAADDAMKWLKEPGNAIAADLTKAYGGWDAIKRTMAEDPARILMDISTIATGGQMALAKAPGVAGKVGRVAGKIGEWTDPVSVAAKGVAHVAEPLATAWMGTQSGVGSAPLREAARAGFTGGQEGLDFRRAFRGDVAPAEIVDTARQGVQNMRDEAQRLYALRKNDKRFGWGEDTKQLNFAPITQAWQDTVSSYVSKSGKRKVGDAEWNQIQKVGDVVSEWERDIRSGAIKGTADDFDALKQRIQSIYPDGEAPKLRRAVTKMAGAVRREIEKQVPGYARAMRDYATASDHLWEIERAFSLGDKASMQTGLSKLQSVMRNNAQTQYGLRNTLLDSIESEGGVSVRPYLAGTTLNSWEPRGLARVVGPAGAIGAGAGLLAGNIPAMLLGSGAAAASVPKIVGGGYHFAGRAAGLPDRIAERVAGMAGASAPRAGFFYDLGRRPARLAARAFGMATTPEEEQIPQRARGGYFGGFR